MPNATMLELPDKPQGCLCGWRGNMQDCDIGYDEKDRLLIKCPSCGVAVARGVTPKATPKE